MARKTYPYRLTFFQKHWILKWFLILLIFTVITVGGGKLGFDYYVNNIIKPVDIHKITSTNEHQVVIKSSDNKILWQKINYPEKQVPIDKIDSKLQNALISIEDRDFYKESGVNYKRTLKSAIYDIIHGGFKQGGSTLTQQLIKNTYYSSSAKDKTLKRKLNEFAMAEKLNQQSSKKEILQWYLNKVFLGYNLYGIDAASKFYFDKSPENLSTTQAALLAGMIQSPTYYNPYERPKETKNRRDTVLYTMYQTKHISKSEFNDLSKTPLSNDVVSLNLREKDKQKRIKKQMQSNNAINSTLNEVKKYKINTETNTQPVEITTSINDNQQGKLVNNIEKTIPKKFKKLQTAVTVIDNKTGKVISQNGGRNQTTLNGYDRSTMNMRSTGSTIKPFVDYAPAFELLKYNKNTLVNDTPFNYPGTNISLHNWDNRYEGTVKLGHALAKSRNIPAIRTLNDVGLGNAHNLMSLMGYTDKLNYADGIGLNVPSISLASYYATLANYGIYKKPSYIKNIKVGNKNIKLKNTSHRAISTRTAYNLTSILKKVPKPTGFGNNAYIKGVTQAGKTGTISYPKSYNMPKNAISDAWYAGYSKQFTIVVWTGFDKIQKQKTYLSNDDSNLSEIIYRKTLKSLNKEYKIKNSNWKKPKKNSNIPISKNINKKQINDKWFKK